MHKRYFPIATVVAVLLAIAVAGFTAGATEKTTPARVVMDNAGGRVIFSHKFHIEDYGLECTDCHHDDIEAETYLACGSCHPSEFNEAFRTDHPERFPDDEACLRCHYDTPTETLSDDDRPDTDFIPLRADAFHTQCMSCHEENGGPYGDDSCNDCHAR